MGKSNREAGSAQLYALVVLAVLVVAGAGWYVVGHRHYQTALVTNASQASRPRATSVAPLKQPLQTGSSDTALNSDVQNISAAQALENQDLQSANQALNDQQLSVNDN